MIYKTKHQPGLKGEQITLYTKIPQTTRFIASQMPAAKSADTEVMNDDLTPMLKHRAVISLKAWLYRGQCPIISTITMDNDQF